MRTNIFSKKCFFESLIKLSKEKDYNEIQISDICKEAGYNRSTFYRTYSSKDDLLADGFITFYVNEYYSMVKNGSFGNDYIKNATLLFSYIRSHSEIFLLMHKAQLDYKMFKMFSNVFPLARDYGKDQLYYIYFQANGYLAVITEWLIHGMRESDEYMGNLIAEIIEKSTIY